MPDTIQDPTGAIGATPTCPQCGSDEVVRDAWARWNPAAGLWELGTVFDESMCENCGSRGDFDWISKDALRKRKIARLNDALRTGAPGPNDMVVVTHGVRALGPEFIEDARKAIAGFDAFDEGDDPYGEHDFGALDVRGERLFWKIDCYDLALAGGAVEPDNPAVTRRVLTIMLASEY
jgi:predicted RNA-binding Zn-ribbon protein involved in translation (DUF1610 family)